MIPPFQHSTTFKEHEVNSLNNFIMGWYAEDTSLCDKIIKCHKNNLTKTPGQVGLGDGLHYGINKNYKDSTDSTLDNFHDLMQEYGSILQSCINKYVEKYEWSAKGKFSNQETTNIQHYAVGGGYPAWHSERMTHLFPKCHRHLVYMTYLNTVECEGETEFYYQKIKIKPEKGLTLIWPADWTFTHRGNIVFKEDKYIVTGWLHYSP